MVTIALVRVIRIHDAADIDLVWQIFWQTMKGCVALLMNSITTFRTVFASQDTRGRDQMRWASFYSWIQRATQRKRNQKSDELKKDRLSFIPRAQLTEMVTYIRGYPMVEETISTGSDMRFLEEDDESQFESMTSHWHHREISNVPIKRRFVVDRISSPSLSSQNPLYSL